MFKKFISSDTLLTADLSVLPIPPVSCRDTLSWTDYSVSLHAVSQNASNLVRGRVKDASRDSSDPLMARTVESTRNLPEQSLQTTVCPSPYYSVSLFIINSSTTPARLQIHLEISTWAVLGTRPPSLKVPPDIPKRRHNLTFLYTSNRHSHTHPPSIPLPTPSPLPWDPCRGFPPPRGCYSLDPHTPLPTRASRPGHMPSPATQDRCRQRPGRSYSTPRQGN